MADWSLPFTLKGTWKTVVWTRVLAEKFVLTTSFCNELSWCSVVVYIWGKSMCMFDNALSLGYLLSAKERERRVSHIKILIRSSIYFTIFFVYWTSGISDRKGAKKSKTWPWNTPARWNSIRGLSVLSKYLTLSFAFRGGNILWRRRRSEVEKTASEKARAWVGFLPEIVALPTNGEDSASGKLFFH